ncbi:MAG TPA: CHAP domain-containing protein, partial [Brumimicrobium sp.]|nr:CHAP domain-containing protein [Brumimicrobium sp.]
YTHLKHKMPIVIEEAKMYFNPSLEDGQINVESNLIQYSNPSLSAPKENDILIYNSNSTHQKGHIAIVSKTMEGRIEIIQQNPGWVQPSRERYSLKKQGDKWWIDNGQIIGWLRKE